VRPLDQQFTERRGIEQTKAGARILDLSVDRRFDTLARLLIAVRATPLADRLPIVAVFLVPLMHRRATQRHKALTPRLANHGGERNGRIRRAERGRSGLRNWLTQSIRKNRQSIDIT